MVQSNACGLATVSVKHTTIYAFIHVDGILDFWPWSYSFGCLGRGAQMWRVGLGRGELSYGFLRELHEQCRGGDWRGCRGGGPVRG